MGYIWLILGLAAFAGAHWVKRLAPEKRAQWGDKGKGVLALLMLAGVVLMVIGYRGAGVVQVWDPPSFMVHIANLLVLIGFWFFALSHMNAVMAAKVRHKQLTGVKSWAVGHLLVNGDLASIILFGGMLAWAVVSVILINKAQPTWDRPANPSVKNDVLAFLIGAVVYGIAAWIHTLLGYYPFPM
jgi:uncharacterized membrane protein